MKTFYYEYVEDCISYLLISKISNELCLSSDFDLEKFLEGYGIFENEAKKFGINMISTTFTN